MENIKRLLPEVLVVALFAIIAFVYFMPADIDGRILFRHDSQANKGLGRESTEYYQRTGERTRWTGSAFCGMPTYQTSPAYNSTQGLSAIAKAYHLWLPDYVWYVFAYMLGFYILLRAFDFRRHLAVLGSIIWAFSSYFFIIIAAGHYWKVEALAYLPPMIAGVVMCFKGRYLWGFVLTALFSALEVLANHVQMTYYYLFIILFMLIAYLVDAIRSKKMVQFAKAAAVCAAGAAVGICMNISNLYHTWEYGQESMRGKSELVKQNSANQTSSGLDRDYITQWSYGIDETWSLLVPNVKGGASEPLSQSETAMKKADPNFMPIYQQIGQYWGDQPGTSGPVYVGAFVMMLFILGLFIVKGSIKWALLAATALSILLSWGHNFMWFTNLFLDYVPMYAKFRTVASILVIAEFTIPLLAMMALKKIVDEPDILNRKLKYVYISFCLTAGFCLLFILMPGVFFSDFISAQEMQAFKQIPAEYLSQLLPNLRSMREAVLDADCWRSFFIIVIGTLMLLLFKAKKIKSAWLITGIIILCVADMWSVNKRYLHDDMFVEASVKDTPIQLTETDKQILQDKSPDYRVLNLASNTFNENETSFYHKSIGGYHAAKLRRYQELIDYYIAPEMRAMMEAVANAGGDMTQAKGDSIWPVINMLNAKYVIMPLQGGQTVPIQNTYSYGNAWLVDKITYVKNANEEMETLGKIDLRHEAVADEKFKSVLGNTTEQGATSVATLTAYDANKVAYDVTTDKGGILVFSEIYYPGWTATIDGQPVEVGRVNYVLRAINIKPGSHKVELSFFPKTVDNTETTAYIATAILVLILVLAIAKAVIASRKKQ